jgi:acetolactate synthase-1/2/3 large subunit
MKLSDYIFCQLREWGARHVFLITGGGAMHLNDSIGTSGLQYICTHHEQAAAMAAEGYARITGKPGILNVTTGPGSINALNGVFGAWTDSIPMLILSGQVKRETCMATYGLTDLRQLGDQEVDIVRMVKGITKYSVLGKRCSGTHPRGRTSGHPCWQRCSARWRSQRIRTGNPRFARSGCDRMDARPDRQR